MHVCFEHPSDHLQWSEGHVNNSELSCFTEIKMDCLTAGSCIALISCTLLGRGQKII